MGTVRKGRAISGNGNAESRELSGNFGFGTQPLGDLLSNESRRVRRLLCKQVAAMATSIPAAVERRAALVPVTDQIAKPHGEPLYPVPNASMVPKHVPRSPRYGAVVNIDLRLRRLRRRSTTNSRLVLLGASTDPTRRAER